MSRDIIAAFPLPALLIGQDERVAAANDDARRLFGAGIDGRHYITVLRQPTLLDAIEAVTRTGSRIESPYLTTDTHRDLTLHATIAPVGHTKELLVVFEDRTDLEEAGQMRRDFVANVSHELRTPLTALLGFIETLRGAARDDPDARGRFLEIMYKEAGRMNRLVGDLLSLSRVEAEERRRPTTEVDLAQLTRSVLTSLAPLAEETDVSLTSANMTAPMPILGDADQISQVITNLVENGIKYAGAGNDVRVSLEHEEYNTMIRSPAATLRVTDSGEGIDPMHLPRLTERFYRIDSHRSREMGGTGLGLAIVKHIVSRHRGRLKIESEPGQGSRFSVILPQFEGAPTES